MTPRTVPQPSGRSVAGEQPSVRVLQEMEEASRFPRAQVTWGGERLVAAGSQTGRRGVGRSSIDLDLGESEAGALPMPGVLGWSRGGRAGHPPAVGFWLGQCHLHIQGKAWGVGSVPHGCANFSPLWPALPQQPHLQQ